MFLFTEELLLESLNSNFKINRVPEHEHKINHDYHGRILPAHTAYVQSDHMKAHDIGVIRMKTNKEHGDHVEFHIHNTKLKPGERRDSVDHDHRATVHTIKIIHDGIKQALHRKEKVKLIAGSADQHKNYQKLAHRMVEKGGNKHKVSVDDKHVTLNGDVKPTTIIESTLTLKESVIMILNNKS